MNKQLKDYLHLYYGAEAKYARPNSWKAEKIDSAMLRHFEQFPNSYDLCKPLLRPLSSMTEEYFLSLFKISMGWFEDAQVTEYKRYATDDLYVRTGFAQYIFSFRKGYENDVRVEQGIAFYTRMFSISESLVVGKSGITKKEKQFENEKIIVAQNQTVIFNKLRKDNYDCDGLIESGLAIDKSKTPTT